MKRGRLAAAAAALALIAACSNPEADWQKAEADGTEAAYQAFLDQHPEGEWAQKAQGALDALHDAHDWENARAADAIESYNNYLLAHPTGAHMGEARQRITEIETERAWTDAQAAGTREALEDFLIRYADAPQAAAARERIAAMSAPPVAAIKPAAGPAAKKPPAAGAKTPASARPAGDYQVQVGAFSTRAKAESEKARVEKRLQPVLGSLAVQPPGGGDQLYRVRSAGMAEAAARSACQKVKNAGENCVVVHR